MSSLLVTEINNDDSIMIAFRIKSSINLAYVRPHIMIEGVLTDGEIVLEVVENFKVLSSSNISYQKLNEVKQNNEICRGFFRFDTNVVLNHNNENEFTEYQIVIKMNNYTINQNNKVSIVSDLNQVVELHDQDSKAAYNLEFYTI